MKSFLARLALACGLFAIAVPAAFAASTGPMYFDNAGKPQPALGVFCVDLTGTYAGCGGGSSQSAPIYASESAQNWTPAQTSVGTTATLICAARAGRRAATIENLGTVPVWLGPSNSVTPTSGALLAGVVAASVTIPTSAAIYAIVGTGTQTVVCLETY